MSPLRHWAIASLGQAFARVGVSLYQGDDFGHINFHKLLSDFVSVKVFLRVPPFHKNEGLGIGFRLIHFESLATLLGERHLGVDSE